MKGYEDMSAIKIVNGKSQAVKVVPSTACDKYISENEIEMDKRAKQAVKVAVEKAEFCKKPVAKYDFETKTAYLLYPDGSRVNVWKKPMVLFLAGPNGSGKSTITHYFEKVGTYTNADDIVMATGMSN